MTTPLRRSDDEHAFTDGAQVQVHTRFDDHWASGFAIAEQAGPAAYRVRRVSDNAVLPAAFDAREIRPDRR